MTYLRHPSPIWVPTTSAHPSTLEVHLDQDRHRGPTTPIAQLYLREIARTAAGDKLILLQKSLTQAQIVRALLEASHRGVDVIAVYRDKLSRECEAYQSSAMRGVCFDILRRSPGPHHKTMVVLARNGACRAIVGSYNARRQRANERWPRTHTALFLEMPRGGALFTFYRAEVGRLLGSRRQTAKTLAFGTPLGEMKFTWHPSQTSPVLEMLNTIQPSRETTIWLSYYQALPDEIGLPTFMRLRELHRKGCQVRVLLDCNRGNEAAYRELRRLGLEVRPATFPAGTAILGHKLTLARAGDTAHVIQSSANLSRSHHQLKHNLTLRLHGRGLLPLHDALETELKRYWGGLGDADSPTPTCLGILDSAG